MTAYDRDYLIAFSTVPEIGAGRLKLLLEYFGSAKEAWEADQRALEGVGLPKDARLKLLQQRRKLRPDRYASSIQERGIKIVTVLDKDYPERLRNIPDPPYVLYIKGRLVEGRAIAVVGTRKMTAYGGEATKRLTTGLVANGFTIVSGLALGVDGLAHATALNCGGKTAAVLGAGVDIVYPREHKELYNNIISHGGTIISEVAPDVLVDRKIFPARNRIISGLSEGVLVTEGAIDSGSLITARAALDQGRDVFAVPGPINLATGEGTNYLLKNGAKLVSSVEDIVEELGH